MIRKINLFSCLKSPQVERKSNFWAWLNIVFNIVDKKRIKEVGPDRACAEWLLRNGGEVTFEGEAPTKDYTALANLPKDVRKRLRRFDASGASIMAYGFQHLKGCEYIEEVKFHKNELVEDDAVACLGLIKSSLKYLEITQCYEVTDTGVKSISQLSLLVNLKLAGLGVKNWADCENHLISTLPNCTLNLQK